MSKAVKRVRVLLLFILVFSVRLSAQGFFSSHSSISGFPDAVDLRVSLRSSITASAWTAQRLGTDIYTSETAGKKVKFQVQTQNNAFYLILTNEREGLFPLFSAGSYIIKRSLEDGGFIQAKIFLKNDPDTFVRLFPFGDRSKIEVFLYGTLVYREVILPRSFEDLLFAPFSRLVSLTEDKIDWGMILPAEDSGPGAIPAMIAEVRKQLPLLPDMDDGAMDEKGRFIYIESGERNAAGGFNCSGFAKYVADGLVYPRTGGLMPVEPLKKKFPDLRGDSWSDRYEEERDPFFGLDWTRNIAAFLDSGEVSAAEYKRHDVSDVPFLNYIEDVGYPVKNLAAALYYEALQYPGTFYLASVNAEFGSDPVLRQHIHVVVLMPYLNSRGELAAAVFERNRETSIDSLIRRYPREHIHLVRLRGSADFQLPPVSAVVAED